MDRERETRHLPPDEVERDEISQALGSSDPEVRTEIYSRATQHIQERVAAARTIAVLYLEDRRLLIGRGFHDLSTGQVNLLLLLGNQERPFSLDEAAKVIGYQPEDLKKIAEDLQETIEPKAEPRYLQTQDGYYFAPKLILEEGIKIKQERQQSQERPLTSQEAALRSNLEPSLVRELYSKWHLLNYGKHYFIRGKKVWITTSGLLHLRRIGRFRTQNPNIPFSKMTDLISSGENRRWQIWFQRSLLPEEREGIDRLIQHIQSTARGKTYTVSVEKLAKLLFRDDLSLRQVDRTRMLIPYIRERTLKIGGLLLIDPADKSYVFSFNPRGHP